MHATVLYRRSALEEAGAFDTTLPAAEDYDMMLRVARRHPVGSHGVVVAEYRQHDANMSRDAERMLTSSLTVLQAQEDRVTSRQEREALESGMDSIKRYYGAQLVRQALLDLARPARVSSALGRLALARRAAPQAYLAVLMGGPRSLLRTVYRALPDPLGRWARVARDRASGRPPLGRVIFGDLRRLEPIDPDFGFGRGIPVDRHYIEAFLARHARDVRGRVLEIGDNTYTLRFGAERVARSDVIDVRADAPHATFIGDLQDAPELPDDAFDCIILTQTLHLIFDMGRALATVRRVLRPGGVLLLTVPGISQTDRGEWGESWYWSLTAASVRRLLAGGWSDVSVETHGNVLSAISFLHGLSAADLTEDELAANDPAYPLVVTARAVKPMDGA
jgi:SAM-dependent methyltransferase